MLAGRRDLPRLLLGGLRHAGLVHALSKVPHPPCIGTHTAACCRTASATAERAAGPASASADRYPTLDECRHQVRNYHEMSGDVLLLLAARGDPEACRERLVREVMHVDRLSWSEATDKVSKMNESVQVPPISRATNVGVVAVSLTAGAASVPMVFHHDVAIWFNNTFVTADVPPEKEIETWLEVGAWAWNWMEPPLGTISFVLLCLQYARAHGGAHPLADCIRVRRQRKLLDRYPNYSRMILLQWAESDLKSDLSGRRPYE